MLKPVVLIPLVLLGSLLPWHGAITVFAPESLRWWKELVLFWLLGYGMVYALFCGFRLSVPAERLNLWQWGNPLLWGAFFLLWGFFLTLINPDFKTALVAYRYLGFGVFAMLLGYGLWKTRLIFGKNGYEWGVKVFHIFCTSFLVGVLTSTLFGLWAKLFGGYTVLAAWYSGTISSWVPGQTIPLYHQVGDFVRIQGASSGPVEYAHLALIGVWYVLSFGVRLPAKWRLFSAWIGGMIVLFIGFGIYHSGSRAALLGLCLLLAFKGYERWLKPKLGAWQWSLDKGAVLVLVGIVLLSVIKMTVHPSVLGNVEILNKNIVRISDIDHLSRPLEAWKMALLSPLIGNLGELGPAARAKNLAEHNNDQAPIAESVPFDLLAQTGFIGFGLWTVMLGLYWRRAAGALRVLLVTFLPLMLLATLFDMTPLAISFYFILGLGLVLPQRQAALETSLEAVLELKQLAFRPYVEQVWGWNTLEQRGFVAQEIAGGHVVLFYHEGQAVATYNFVTEAAKSHLYSVYVHPDWQGLGLGSCLLQMPDLPDSLHLSVLKVNSRAKAFYQRLGFVVVGEDHFHYHLSRHA